ncbi:MAG: GDCCVxC domain-containing (seleno)protein, partial [Salinibacter sp.]
SILTCPECGTQSEEEMPTNGCQFFWECPTCDTLLRPEDGDCCVFCSYGSVPCPPVQKASESASGCAD